MGVVAVDHEHFFQPCGSFVMARPDGKMSMLVFGMCGCGFSIASPPYLVSAGTEEPETEPEKKTPILFGKGGRA